jgi:uncharacterized protein (TIGR03086 family)
MELVDLYAGASEWTAANARAATADLEAPTPCEDWEVRTLLNHLVQTQRYFVGSARGEEVAPPTGEPPEVGEDPATAFSEARREVLDTFGRDEVLERTGPLLGIAFADVLVHGWDLARAAGVDDTMPAGLAEAAYQAIHGKFTDEQREGTFGPEVTVDDDASAQDKLLAYTGRDPSAD